MLRKCRADKVCITSFVVFDWPSVGVSGSKLILLVKALAGEAMRITERLQTENAAAASRWSLENAVLFCMVEAL